MNADLNEWQECAKNKVKASNALQYKDKRLALQQQFYGTVLHPKT